MRSDSSECWLTNTLEAVVVAIPPIRLNLYVSRAVIWVACMCGSGREEDFLGFVSLVCVALTIATSPSRKSRSGIPGWLICRVAVGTSVLGLGPAALGVTMTLGPE